MNPQPAAPATTPTPTPTPTMYGFPVADWTLPRDSRTPFLNRLYEDAFEVLTEPDGPTAAAWRHELDEAGYRAVTAPLSLPQIVSLVSELPPSVIVRLTGIAPGDKSRQEVVRMLYTEPEGD